MKKVLLLVFCIVFVSSFAIAGDALHTYSPMGTGLPYRSSPPAPGDTSVHGYTRDNGAYVEPYHRSNPNNTQMDNWSSRPNVNPYTGMEGTRTPGY